MHDMLHVLYIHICEHLCNEELMHSNYGAENDSRVFWTARRSNQLILKEINPEYSLKGLMLKLQYFGPDAKNQLIRKDPDARKD